MKRSKWLTVVSPGGSEDIELVLEPMGFPPANIRQEKGPAIAGPLSQEQHFPNFSGARSSFSFPRIPLPAGDRSRRH